jgi:hypothetical protein
MVRQLRHRQTKGAATVATNLKPPRHISTLQEALAALKGGAVRDLRIVAGV